MVYSQFAAPAVSADTVLFSLSKKALFALPDENKIRVLYLRSNMYPGARVIEHTLVAMQALVGIDIEAACPWKDTVEIDPLIFRKEISSHK